MKLYLVGIGPGNERQMTAQAMEALGEADLIVGYSLYVQLVRQKFPHKEFLATPMTKEVERCRLALEQARQGRTVAMVCSGDAGVYGMAGLVYQLAQQGPPVEIEVVPGITSACAGAALLGAPLMHDFAVISLSDLLTPLDLIHRRLKAAAEADFVLCLYNPSSKRRAGYLRDACDIVLQSRPPQTVCGLAQNIGREGECSRVLTLQQLRETPVDMFTTVLIGNSNTMKIGQKMVTPRGYRVK